MTCEDRGLSARPRSVTRRRPAGCWRVGATAVLLAVAGAATAVPALAADAAAPSFALTHQWVLGGEGSWDYLAFDARRQRLFVTRGDRVMVVDAGNGKLVGTIPGTAGVHGVAFAEDLGKGFTSNGRGNSVTEFDLATLAVTREVPIPGANPDAILYEPHGRHLYTFNGKSKDATVLDAARLEVVATIPLHDRPEFAVDDGAGHIYLNIETEPGKLAVIDSGTLTLQAVWPLDGCNSPSGLALDVARSRLFSVCDDKVMAVTDARDGHAVARATIGDGPDAAVYDPALGLTFSSNGAGTLSVLAADGAKGYRTLATVPTMRGAKTMAYDAASRRVFLATAQFGPTPEPTADQPHPRPKPLPGTFTILVVEGH